MKTLYREHFLSYRFKCWDDYWYTYFELHTTRNILYTPSFNIPSHTWNIPLANKEVTIACLLLCYQHTVNNALNCLSRELFKCIAEEWYTFCLSRMGIQKGVRMRYISVWIYGLRKRKMGPTILVELIAHHTPTLTSHNDIPCEPPTWQYLSQWQPTYPMRWSYATWLKILSVGSTPSWIPLTYQFTKFNHVSSHASHSMWITVVCGYKRWRFVTFLADDAGTIPCCASRAQDFLRGLQISKNFDKFLLFYTGSGCSLSRKKSRSPDLFT